MKLEPGNTNYELAWGCGGIVDYLDALGGGTGDRAAIERAFDAIAAHEAAIGERLLSYLRDRNDVRIVGRAQRRPARARVPTISFKVEGRDSAAIVAAVDADRIGIRYGDFHSRRLIEHLGLAAGNGVVRVSMVHYNTLEEVDRLIASLDRALSSVCPISQTLRKRHMAEFDMAEFDLAIRGGTVVTAADSVRAATSASAAGASSPVAERIEGAAREIDASGLLVLPGGIDSHVHIAQSSGPGIVMADDFASATAAAAAGGNTS